MGNSHNGYLELFQHLQNLCALVPLGGSNAAYPSGARQEQEFLQEPVHFCGGMTLIALSRCFCYLNPEHHDGISGIMKGNVSGV